MAIQDRDALVLDALSILHDPRPHPKQPVLNDGVYLHWLPGANRAFPLKGGYHLLRRRVGGTAAPAPVCLIPLLKQSNVATVASQPGVQTNIGILARSGGQHLLPIPSTAGPLGIAGFRLDGQLLRFSLPQGVTATQFTVRLRCHWGPAGMRAQVTGKLKAAVAFSQTVLPPPSPPPPPPTWEVTVTANARPVDTIEIEGFSVDLIELCYVPILAGSSASSSTSGSSTTSSSGPGQGWELVPNLTAAMTLPLVHPQYPASAGAESINASTAIAKPRVHYGAWADSFRAATRTAGAGKVTLTQGSAIVTGSGGTNWTADLVGKLICVPKGGADFTAYAVMSVLGPDRSVLSRAYSGATQSNAPYDLLEGDDFAELHDRIACLVQSPSGMRAATSPPVLDQGTVAGGTFVQAFAGLPAVQGIGTHWNASLNGSTIEIGPVRAGHAYVAGTTAYRIQSVTSATQMTLDRPFVGTLSVTPATGDYQIVARASDTSMDANIPSLDFKPMELIELASLMPGYAQALGLSWIDTAVAAGDVFDYIVIADHQNRFLLQTANALRWMNGTPDFSGDAVDGYVFAGVHHVGTPPLPPPGQMELFRLPVGVARISIAHPDRANFDAAISVKDAASWKNAAPGQPAPVMMNLWRLARGTDATKLLPAGNPNAYQDLEKMVPSADAAIAGLQLPAGWPTAPIHFIDSGSDGTGLDVGWYSYIANNIDWCGRWSPVSAPIPWTVIPSSSPAVADAVHLEDRLPPPPPAGVLAWVLDDADQYLLKDAAYASWKAAFAPNAPPIGLRVSWRWPWPHRNQGPDLREFRIYLQSRPLNARTGRVTSVAPAADPAQSVVTFRPDTPDTAAPNAYKDADLHAGDRSYRVVASQPGATLQLTVKNGGPSNGDRPDANVDGAIVIPAGHALHKELLDPKNWPSWLAAVPQNLAGTRDDIELVEDASTKTGLQGSAATWNAATRVLSLDGNPDLSNVVAGTDLVYVEAAGANLAQLVFFYTVDAVDTAARTVTLNGTPAQLAALTTGAPFKWSIGWPVRYYEVFLPNPAVPAVKLAPSLNIAALLKPSLGQPVAYGTVGVSSADRRDEIADAYPYPPARNRKGNEGFLAGPATVFRVLRDPPAAPTYNWKAPLLATKANYKSESYFSVRWNNPGAGYFAHVFRAMDSSLFLALWKLNPSPPLATMGAPATMPAFLIAFNALKTQYAAHTTAAATGLAQADYQAATALFAALDDKSLYWLAGRPELSDAFMQITIKPLDLADPANADRLGPDDDPAKYVQNPSVCAYVDTLPGRSTNKHFYAVMVLDGAQNRSALGALSLPVYVPNVTPPRTPVVTKAKGSDRQITLRWVCSREERLKEYQVFRTTVREDAADLRRLGNPVATLTVANNQQSRPPEIVFEDYVPGGVTFYYKITAIDTSDNVSPAFAEIAARAFDLSLPEPPAWISAEWVDVAPDGSSAVVQIGKPVNTGTRPAVRVFWSTATVCRTRLERRALGRSSWSPASAWLPSERFDTAINGWSFSVLALDADPSAPCDYRILTESLNGRAGEISQVRTVGRLQR